MFCVVNFPEENSVAVVPQAWVSGNKCYWPNYTEDRQLERAVKSIEKCNKRNWRKCPVRILHSYRKFKPIIFNLTK